MSCKQKSCGVAHACYKPPNSGNASVELSMAQLGCTAAKYLVGAAAMRPAGYRNVAHTAESYPSEGLHFENRHICPGFKSCSSISDQSA